MALLGAILSAQSEAVETTQRRYITMVPSTVTEATKRLEEKICFVQQGHIGGTMLSISSRNPDSNAKIGVCHRHSLQEIFPN